MSALEWLAAAFGLANIVLIVRRSVWNYPFGIILVALYAVVFWRAKLYSDAGLQLFFFVVQFYGWRAWSRVEAERGEVVVEALTGRGRLAWALGCAAGTAGWGALMHRFTDASYPWWDAGVAVVSVAAQILMTRRLIENWALWIGVDAVSVGLYAAKGLWPTMILYAVFLFLAAWGLVGWHAARHRQGLVAA